MQVDDKLAKEKQLFVEWFTANYPPHCVISNPAWHADKIYRIARKLIRNTDLTDCAPDQGSVRNATDMRERCAKEAEYDLDPCCTCEGCDARRAVAKAIRALPVLEHQKD